MNTERRGLGAYLLEQLLFFCHLLLREGRGRVDTLLLLLASSLRILSLRIEWDLVRERREMV